MSNEVSNIIPNFRSINDMKPNESNYSTVYRSSCVDYIPENQLENFEKLGIDTVIDLRSLSEYSRTNGEKLIDKTFSMYKVKFGWSWNLKPGEELQYTAVSNNGMSDSNNSHEQDEHKEHLVGNKSRNNPEKRHYFLDLFTPGYMWNCYNQTPWYMKLGSLIYLLIDLVKRVHFVNFVRFFSLYINRYGMLGQYKNFVNFSQKPICAVMKILATHGDRPVLIDCAHGKDRTGVLSALVQSCLGWPVSEVADDYSLSSGLLAPMMPHMRQSLVEKYNMSEDFLLSERETMLELLAYIRQRYGSIPEYLEQIGFGMAEQEQLRRNFGTYTTDTVKSS